MALTSVIRNVKMVDSAGEGVSGKIFSDFTIAYMIDGGTLTSLTPENITTIGTYAAPTSAAHIRIKEINSANPTKGWYQLQFHDTQWATGTRMWIGFYCAGALATEIEFDLENVKTVNVSQINGSTTAAAILATFFGGQETGTAQAGAAGSITLRSGASGSDNFYKDMAVLIASGTGAGQVRRITGYVGSTKIASVAGNWVTDPDNTSIYVLMGRIE